MLSGAAGAAKSAVTDEPLPAPLTAVCAAASPPPPVILCTNEKISEPSVSVPLSVLVKVLEVPLKANVASLPSMVTCYC